MNKRINKIIITSILVVSFIIGSCYSTTYANNPKIVNYKEYIILANDVKEHKLKSLIEDNKIKDEIVENDDIYGIKVSVTKQQIDEMCEKENFVVSEDIMLNASSKQKYKMNRHNIKKNNSNESEWNMKMINSIHKKRGKNGTKVKVAILDSGIDFTNEITVKERINLIPGEENVFTPFEDTTGHGTSIAGILAAKDNIEGITGINPNVEIYSARILDDNNQAPLSRVVEGIYWAIEKKVNIINMSFGTNQNSEVLYKAIQDAYNAGILIVAAAGNSGGIVEYPAAYEEVIAVGSVDSEGVLSDTSAYGEQLDITAPGENVKTTGSFGGEFITSGTSISVPHVVGVASILWEKDINCSNEFIRQLLIVSSNRSNDDTIKENGIVDLEYALSVYDEFKSNYNSKVYMKDVIEENKNTLYTEAEKVVNARWTDEDNKKGHVTLANAAGKTHSLSSAKIKILKLGIKYPDQKFPSRKTNPQWHTCDIPQVQTDNYISSYRCATLIAKVLKKDKKVNKENVARPSGMKSANYNNMISQVQGIPWSSALGEADVTGKNKALFVIGMAMHIVTDTYAHQSYRKEDGKWKPIEHKDDCDNHTVEGKRYELAESAACDVLQTYLEKETGDHWEYVQDYDGKSFKLHKLAQYTKNQETYNARTFGELSTIKKGSIKDE